MSKLIYNEVYKIMHKKSIYLIFFLLFIIVIANNLLFMITYNDDGVYQNENERNIEEEINDLETKLDNLESLEFVDTKTALEILKIKNNYPLDSFQYNMTENYFYDIIYNINYYKYIVIDEEQVAYYESIYYEYLNRFNNNDNLSFIKDKLSIINERLEVDSNNFNLKLEKEVLELRINNNIDYSNTYLNRALDSYYKSSLELENYQDRELNHQEKILYNNLVTNKNVSKYIVDNNINLEKENDLRGCLKTILEDYEIIIVIVIIVVSASNVSEEYSKGTIKQLLTKPYSRTKILLSKFVACLLILMMSIIFLILIELWIGGVIFGFDSLKIPVIVYDLNMGNLKEYNIFIYMFLRIFYNIPKLLLILTICFGISTIFLNSVIASIGTLCIYIFNDTFINLLSKYKVTKYLLTTNWNLISYINGNVNKYFDITINFSIIVCFLYFLLLNLLIFVIFSRRDIKNI